MPVERLSSNILSIRAETHASRKPVAILKWLGISVLSGARLGTLSVKRGFASYAHLAATIWPTPEGKRLFATAERRWGPSAEEAAEPGPVPFGYSSALRAQSR